MQKTTVLIFAALAALSFLLGKNQGFKAGVTETEAQLRDEARQCKRLIHEMTSWESLLRNASRAQQLYYLRKENAEALRQVSEFKRILGVSGDESDLLCEAFYEVCEDALQAEYEAAYEACKEDDYYEAPPSRWE